MGWRKEKKKIKQRLVLLVCDMLRLSAPPRTAFIAIYRRVRLTTRARRCARAALTLW